VAVSFRKSIGIPPAGRNDKIFPEHTLTTDKPEERSSCKGAKKQSAWLLEETTLQTAKNSVFSLHPWIFIRNPSGWM
jgi:hypothetical protein